MAEGDKVTQRISGPFNSDADFWRANIVNSFLDFGFEPTEAEITQLIPTSKGIGGFQRGRASVAQFVQTRNAFEQQQASDPLRQFVTSEAERATGLQTRSQDLFQNALEAIQRAPQLFGSLTKEQIPEFLAPLSRQREASAGRLAGDFGRRGITGSSVEANSLAEQERRFIENVLSTGLQVGQQQQTSEVNALTGRSNTLFAGANQAFGNAGSGASQLSSQELDTLRFIQTLPFLLRASASQDRATEAALNQGSGLGGSIGNLAGTVLGGAVGAFGGPAGIAIGAGLGGQLGGGIGSAVDGGNNGSVQANTANLLPFLLAASQRGQTTTNPTVNNPVDTASLLRNRNQFSGNRNLSLTGGGR